MDRKIHLIQLKNFGIKLEELKILLMRNSFIYNIYKLVQRVMTLPHSSAEAERYFSKLALMKNSLTNRLLVKTCDMKLSALNLLDNQYAKDWIPSHDMIENLKKMNKKESLTL